MHALTRQQLILARPAHRWCGALNWPVMKLGVTGFPPLSFRTLSMWIGLPVLAGVLLCAAGAVRMAREHWRELRELAVFNMLFWHTLIILAVQSLSSGRAAILGYTMPVFSALIGAMLVWPAPGRAGLGRRGRRRAGRGAVAVARDHRAQRAAAAAWP